MVLLMALPASDVNRYAHQMGQSLPISNQQVGLGFPHRAGRYHPRDLRFRPQVVGVVEICKDFQSGDETQSFPSAATSALARGATLAARWLYEPQPISNQPVGLGLPHRAGRYRPG